MVSAPSFFPPVPSANASAGGGGSLAGFPLRHLVLSCCCCKELRYSNTSIYLNDISYINIYRYLLTTRKGKHTFIIRTWAENVNTRFWSKKNNLLIHVNIQLNNLIIRQNKTVTIWLIRKALNRKKPKTTHVPSPWLLILGIHTGLLVLTIHVHTGFIFLFIQVTTIRS